MLTKSTIIPESSGIQIPIRFIPTEDGLFAVTEQENGTLGIATKPITFVSQPLLKTIDGNLILQQPVFRINLENIENDLQSTIFLPGDTGTDKSSTVPTDTMLDKPKFQSPEESDATRVEQVIPKRSPGRPRKNSSRPPCDKDNKCDICGQSFYKQSLYRKHMDHHAEEKPHRCPKCSASFNVPSNFTLHMATHNAGEPKCPECGRKFARMASLKSHMLVHEKEENLFCTECEDAFATRE